MAISKINGGKNGKRKSGFFGIAIIAVVALSIVALIFWKKLDLEKELEIKQQQLDGYNAQIETAHAKTAEIENEIKNQPSLYQKNTTDKDGKTSTIKIDALKEQIQKDILSI